MERIQALIDKLHHQKQTNASPAQLLFTVQLLHSELLQFQQKNGTLGTSKVAVTLPVNMNFSEEVSRTTVPEPQPEPVMDAQKFSKEKEPGADSVMHRPVVAEEELIQPFSRYAPQPQQPANPAFNTVVETPTLAQYQSKKDLNELIAERRESLNDRLKQEKKEVAHAIKDAPIKDLRKGIGINDRFTFVKELFRGDDAFYERSIKTINSFSIYAEAEYWIHRELKYKIGWDEDNETVQHFYGLVKRRFS